MREIELDASNWSSADDFYEALLPNLGAPGWHGHNLNALWDSITSDINEVMPPFRVRVRHANNLSSDMAALLAGASSVFVDAKNERGIDVFFNIC